MIEELLRQDSELQRAKINSEAAKIRWKELQRYYAGGNTLYLSADLDLVDVAFAFARDDVETVGKWTDSGRITAVSNDQAKAWFESDCSVWAVVVKPWVLVQDIENS